MPSGRISLNKYVQHLITSFPCRYKYTLGLSKMYDCIMYKEVRRFSEVFSKKKFTKLCFSTSEFFQFITHQLCLKYWYLILTVQGLVLCYSQ